MFLRILSESFVRRKRRKVIGILAVTLGSCLATALIGITIQVGDDLSRELSSFGSNLVMRPQVYPSIKDLGPLSARPAISVEDVKKIKNIFWANNITALAPLLNASAELRGENIRVTGTWFDASVLSYGSTGVKALYPHWLVQGEWPRDDVLIQGLLGRRVADRLRLKIGDSMELQSRGKIYHVAVSGILETGDEFENQLIVPLVLAQEMTGILSGVDEVYIRALTTPESELEKVHHRNPRSLSAEEYERWSCTPFMSTIISQIEGEIAGVDVEPVLEVAQREGVILERVRSLFIFICAASLLTAGVGLMSTLMATVVERRKEIGLLRALGAETLDVVSIFAAEILVISVLGCVFGAGLGFFAGDWISREVFHISVRFNLIVVWIVAMITLLISLIGGIYPIRMALRMDPARVLHEN